jgi:hypothetical protein
MRLPEVRLQRRQITVTPEGLRVEFPHVDLSRLGGFGAYSLHYILVERDAEGGNTDARAFRTLQYEERAYGNGRANGA